MLAYGVTTKKRLSIDLNQGRYGDERTTARVDCRRRVKRQPAQASSMHTRSRRQTATVLMASVRAPAWWYSSHETRRVLKENIRPEKAVNTGDKNDGPDSVT